MPNFQIIAFIDNGTVNFRSLHCKTGKGAKFSIYRLPYEIMNK